MKIALFAIMLLFAAGFVSANNEACVDVRMCVDGSDDVIIESGHMTLAHYSYNPIGAPGDCPTEYQNVIFIDDTPYPLSYHDGQYWQGDSFFDVFVSLEGITDFTKNLGRGSVTQNGNALFINDNDFGGGDVYDLTICGPPSPEVPEFGLIAGIVAMVGAAGMFIVLRRR
jgi:hypothetical protein